jgi:hypothetical protein
MAEDGPKPGRAPLWQRLLWFVGLWAGGVVAVAAVAYGIKAVIAAP